MINLKITHKNIVNIIYLSFAFDSLLKINIGIKIHLGIISILLFNAYYLITKGWEVKLKFLKQDFWLILFTVYIFISGVLKTGTTSLFMFFYFFLALNVYHFISVNFEFFTKKTFIKFQKILIITGLFQYGLYLLFKYQINFLDDINHYSHGGSVPRRIRGFFVEPNWHAIAIAFNTFLLIGNNIKLFVKQHTLLFVLTIFIMLLNGSMGTFAIFIGVYGYVNLKRNVIIGVLLGVLSIFLTIIVLSFRTSKTGRIFNSYSRLEPINRVIKHLKKQPVSTVFWGEGFGSWGTKAIKNRLSVLRYKPNPYARDGSELPVFILELGIIGTLLFFLDWLTLMLRNHKKDHHVTGALLLFLVSFLLYPIFQFFMYMIYYYMFRIIIHKKRLMIDHE